MDKAKSSIEALIDKYQKAKEAGVVNKYNEEETKNAFIMPLFEALGWDFSQKDEVSAEEKIISSGRVDYGFYINGRARFYLEAKPLRADLQREEFARQAIRYAFNKGVTWAILTDFESIKIFNAQAASNYLGDKMLFDIKYSEFIDRFDELWLLSKESIVEDLIDREAEKRGKKLQKIPITELLYKDLNECRKLLTYSLGAYNESVPRDLLDEGVQKLLDRLVFIRVAEDRKIEPSILVPLINQWKTSPAKVRLYESMIHKFREMDDIYNSNLFTPHPFEKWEDDGGALQKVIDILYGKKGYYEYDFSIMPADVLGSVYENYLGFKLSQSQKGLTLDKAAGKRKEQGIYYTPAFIVDYIVKNSLKPILDNCKSVNDLKKVKILDPACGSGSFLIRALEVMVDKYKEFTYDDTEELRIQIILENLYGVDLDEQAVEIARLNLLINALGKRGKLPNLDNNIKNGNSLISGTDIELQKYFGKNFRDKKPFNWEEKFPDIFKQGGFDVIIGNPPYIFARGGNFDDQEKKYYSDSYKKLQQYQLNTFLLFIEKGYDLLKKNGSFGFIIPNNWLTINSFSKLREFLLKNTGSLKIINAIESVFSQASVDTCLLMFKKSMPTDVEVGELLNGESIKLSRHKPEDFYKNEFIINISQTKNKNKVLKLANAIPLGEIADVKSGIVAYEVGKGKPPQTGKMKDDRIYHSETKQGEEWVKYIDGVDVRRYFLGWSGEYIKYGENLAAQRKGELFQDERLLVRQIPSRLPYCINAVYTDESLINDRNSNNILNPKSGYRLKYILGILNSKLLSYWFIQTFDKFQRKIFPQFKVNELAQFPIYKATSKQQDKIIALVNIILKLNGELSRIEKNSNGWNFIKEEIERTDKKIDEEIYKLYALTPEEITIVEGEDRN